MASPCNPCPLGRVSCCFAGAQLKCVHGAFLDMYLHHFFQAGIGQSSKGVCIWLLLGSGWCPCTIADGLPSLHFKPRQDVRMNCEFWKW